MMLNITTAEFWLIAGRNFLYNDVIVVEKLLTAKKTGSLVPVKMLNPLIYNKLFDSLKLFNNTVPSE